MEKVTELAERFVRDALFPFMIRCRLDVEPSAREITPLIFSFNKVTEGGAELEQTVVKALQTELQAAEQGDNCLRHPKVSEVIRALKLVQEAWPNLQQFEPDESFTPSLLKERNAFGRKRWSEQDEQFVTNVLLPFLAKHQSPENLTINEYGALVWGYQRGLDEGVSTFSIHYVIRAMVSETEGISPSNSNILRERSDVYQRIVEIIPLAAASYIWSKRP